MYRWGISHVWDGPLHQQLSSESNILRWSPILTNRSLQVFAMCDSIIVKMSSAKFKNLFSWVKRIWIREVLPWTHFKTKVQSNLEMTYYQLTKFVIRALSLKVIYLYLQHEHFLKLVRAVYFKYFCKKRDKTNLTNMQIITS